LTTVLYVHGLESGPQGRKAQHLARAGFTVVSEQMPCGRARAVRDPVVLAGAASAVAVVAGGAVVGGGFGLVVGAVVVGLSAPFVPSRLMRRIVRRSVEVQARALAAHRIDVVVGSSFGGAVALELLLRGLWSGPTVLLCPAQALVARRARWPLPPTLTRLPDALGSRVVVVHGRGDVTVPLADSEVLVARSRARLIEVDDDHRLSVAASPEALAGWIALC